MAIENTLREFIQEELAGTYTITMVIVESVDHETRRAEVSFKYESDIIIDNVPIASPFIGDDAGVIFPVEQDDEGFILHNRNPMDDGLEERGHLDLSSDRRYQMEDAILFPMIWNGEITIPNHQPGEYLIAHDTRNNSGDPSLYRMKPDGTIRMVAGEQSSPETEVSMNPDGSVTVVHGNGNEISMNADGSVTLGDPSNAKPVLNTDAVIEYEDTGDSSDGSAGTTTKTANITDAGTDNVDGA
jgi:hypothetical protein